MSDKASLQIRFVDYNVPKLLLIKLHFALMKNSVLKLPYNAQERRERDHPPKRSARRRDCVLALVKRHYTCHRLVLYNVHIKQNHQQTILHTYTWLHSFAVLLVLPSHCTHVLQFSDSFTSRITIAGENVLSW